MTIDHVLLIGFGGPRNPDEVLPFIYNVTRGKHIPEQRLKEVAKHYIAAGGTSPYNSMVENLSNEICNLLKTKKLDVPVFWGMRIWQPFLLDVMLDVKNLGLKKGVAVVLSPHRSEVSYDRYVAALNQARRINNATDVHYRFLKPWHEHPIFIKSHVAMLEEIKGSTYSSGKKIFYLFTAHSVPAMVAGDSGYDRQIQQSAALIAGEAGLKSWGIGYQSRSGSPYEAWLEPDIKDVMTRVRADGFEAICAVPVGFVLENMEILYDLDIEAKNLAQELGLEYYRTRAVSMSPQFPAMFADLIRDVSGDD